MKLFLKNKNNEIIITVNLHIKDNCIEICSIIHIEPYSNLLLEIYSNDKQKAIGMIQNFEQIQKLEKWLQEIYFINKENVAEEFSNVLKILKEYLDRIGKNYGLFLVES